MGMAKVATPHKPKDRGVCFNSLWEWQKDCAGCCSLQEVFQFPMGMAKDKANVPYVSFDAEYIVSIPYGNGKRMRR